MTTPDATIVWSPEAQSDLSDIWDYHLEVAGRRTADRIVRKIVDTSLPLEAHPFAGRARDEIRKRLRSLAAKPYVLFYRVRADLVEIVLDGRRDLDDLLGEG